MPLDEIGTDPNSGTTYGFLPIFLHSEHDQIRRIIAPDVTYNSDLGYGGSPGATPRRRRVEIRSEGKLSDESRSIRATGARAQPAQPVHAGRAKEVRR